MTGWGQERSEQAAGHDINYIALGGALAVIGEPGRRSMPPLNLAGDFGGGSMFLAFGIVAALFERSRSGSPGRRCGDHRRRLVADELFDGLAAGWAHLARPAGAICSAAMRLSGRTYLCRDGREVAIGPLEPHFYQELLDVDRRAGRIARRPI